MSLKFVKRRINRHRCLEQLKLDKHSANSRREVKAKIKRQASKGYTTDGVITFCDSMKLMASK